MTMAKKIIWTALAAAASALAASLALRVVERIWRGLLHESPPEAPKWSRLLLAGPLRSMIHSGLGRPPW
jgi:hypothetical protein